MHRKVLLVGVAGLITIAGGGRRAFADDDTTGCPSDDKLNQYLNSPPAQADLDGQTTYNLKQHAGDPNGLDDILKTLWGNYCADQQTPFIKADLDKARAAYASASGLDPAVEALGHKAMLDDDAWQGAQQSACNNEPGDDVDPVQAMVIKAACRSGDDRQVIAAAWSQMDGGTTNPVFAGAIMTYCGVMAADDPADYFGWRQCMIDAKVDPGALFKALQASGASPWVVFQFMSRFASAEQALAAMAPAMAKHEAKDPTDKQLVDDTIAQVNKFYMPIFAKWEPQIQEINSWEAGVKSDPAQAAGCIDKFTKELQAYVTTAVPKAHGNDLLLALKDPVGYHISEALAICYDTLRPDGSAEDNHEGYIVGTLLPGGTRVDGFHDAVYTLLAQAIDAGKYKGVPLSSSHGDLFGSTGADALTVNPLSPGNDPYDFGSPFKVKGVAKYGKADRFMVTFPTDHVVIPIDYCDTDYSHVDHYDDFGQPIYPLMNCVTKSSGSDVTPHPRTVGAQDAAALKAGVLASFMDEGTEDDNTTERAIVRWTYKDAKAKDVNYALGVSVP